MTPGALAAPVDALSTALTGVAGVLAPEVAWRLTDDEVLVACHELSVLRARTEAAYLAVVAEVDRRRAAAGTRTATGGGTSLGSTTEGFLRSAALVSAAQARRDVAAAHALHGRTPDRGPRLPALLPVLRHQLGQGSITREHVDVAVRCLDRIPRHVLAASAEQSPPERAGTDVRDIAVSLVSEVAGSGTAGDLDRACQVLLARLDPDGRRGFDPLAHERRFLDMTTDGTGMLMGRFQLDAAAGSALRAAVDAHSSPSPSDDGVRDPRSARQRRADALLVVAESARASAAPVRGEPARVVVHVTPEQLASAGSGAVGVGWAESGERVDRTTARRLSCDAVLQRVVGEPSAGPLEVGREVRLAGRTQRRALAARDRGCVVPGCGAPPGACDAHHVRHWADGGATDLGNLVLLCGSHHTAVHAGTWSVLMCEDGIPEMVPPRWVDPDRRPRRLGHHLVEAAVLRVGRRDDVGAEGGTQARTSDGYAPCVDPPPRDPPHHDPPHHDPPHDGAGGLAVVLTLRASSATSTRSRAGPEGPERRPSRSTVERHLVALLDTG